MRTLKLTIIISIMTFASLNAHCQLLHRLVRGHFENDIYVYASIEEPYNGMYLLYLTLDGSEIAMQNNSYLFFGDELTAEPGPGLMVGHSHQAFGQSSSYGKSFFLLNLFVNDYTGIDALYGGEIPGEYIIQGFDPSVYPYPMGVIYKTSDYFANYTLIADSCNGIYFGEVGHVSGELYQMPIINKYAFLTHSLDFGVTSDTISVDTTIINENSGLFFEALSRGSAQGELFLITKQSVSASEIHYYIYHSIDYGASWQFKSTKVFDSDRQQFTAGRGSCKFYIANLLPVSGSVYYKLQIQFSSDCGETFTTYEHLLTPEVGIEEFEKESGNITVSPNPAKEIVTIGYKQDKPGKVTLRFYSNDGKLIDIFSTETQNQGEQSLSYKCGKFKPGIYSVVIQDASGETRSGKFVVTR